MYDSEFRTEKGTIPPPDRRVAVFFSVLAAHIGMFILLILSRPAELPPKEKGALSAFTLAAATQLAPPIPIVASVVPVQVKPANPSPTEIYAEQQFGKGEPDGKTCSPLDEVSARLASDPLVPLAITRVPTDNRSISEAIVMWNAEWSSAAINDEAPMAEVRRLIHGTLSDLPPDCLAIPVIGPRLIAIPDKEGLTTFLAFGSGEWSWQQLVEPPSHLLSEEDNSWNWKDLFADDAPPNL